MFALTALILMAQVAGDASVPVRTPVASFPIIPAKPVTHVEAMRVDFLPGQQMPEHMHPVPVVCFVAKGSFAVYRQRTCSDCSAGRGYARASGRDRALFSEPVDDRHRSTLL